MIAPYFPYEINHGVVFSLGSSHMFAVILPYLEIQMSSRLLWSSSGSRGMQVFLYANSSLLCVFIPSGVLCSYFFYGLLYFVLSTVN
jgi:hypothetical protein